MKRILSLVLAALLVMSFAVFASASPYTGNVDAEAVLLVDMTTGEILFAKNETLQVHPSGTTKLMTALVAYELCDDLDAEFTIDAAALSGITVSNDKTLTPMLSAGETVTMREILCGVLIGSGNDAAAVAAYHTAGSQEAFVQKMNEKAASLGMTGTNFMNPHGRNGDNHYSTAVDMGKLMSAIYNTPVLLSILNSESATVGERTVTSGNLFFTGDSTQSYSKGAGSLGGYTVSSGGCLVSSAQYNGTTLLCMVFKAPDKDGPWITAKSLFEYAFSLTVTYTAQELFSEIPLEVEKMTLTPDFSGITVEVSKYLDVSSPTVTIREPASEDTDIGYADFYAKDGTLLASVPVTFARTKPPLIIRILKVILIVVIVIVALAILAFVILKILQIRNSRIKAKRRAERDAQRAKMREEQRKNIDFSEFTNFEE